VGVVVRRQSYTQINSPEWGDAKMSAKISSIT